MDTYPIDLLTPTANPWTLGGQVMDGGRSLSGFVQLDRFDGGPFWSAALVNVQVYGEDRILAMQSFQALLDGGAATIILPRLAAVHTTAGDDGLPFSASTLYTGTPTASVEGGADLYDSQVVLRVLGGMLKAGHDFSVDHDDVGLRLYRVRKVISSTPSGGDVLYTVEISPPMRDDVTAAHAVLFADAGCVMRCINPEEIIASLDFNMAGQFTAKFEEQFFGDGEAVT